MPSPTHLPASRLRPTALACTSLILGVMLSGCGGGSSGDAVTQTDSGYQVASGVAQKGPLARGSWISINELNPNTLAPVGTSFNFEIRDDLGTFQPDSTVFTRPLLESTAMGYYFDELTGKVSTDVVILRGMSDLAVDRAVNINLLTDLANARTRALMTRTTSPLKFAAARAQAQREVLQALFLFNSSDLLPGGTTEPASFGELDLSKNRNADQVLAALSAVVTQIGVTGGGINQFINQFEADLLDDGLINNSPRFASSLTTKLNTAFKTVDFAKLAANLNTFYGTTRYTAAALSQWVDTSGGVDKVIDRYKSTAANIPVGTESKSVEYVAGTNDAGQCISSSTGKLYRNGVEVTTGTVKAVKGDKYVLGLTATTASTVNGFIQRTATSAGLCPATKPITGTIRLNKHFVKFIEIPSSTIITTASIVGTTPIYWQGIQTGTGENLKTYLLKKDGSLYVWNQLNPEKIIKIISQKSVKNISSEENQLNVILTDGSEGEIIESTMPPTSDCQSICITPKVIGSGYKKIVQAQKSIDTINAGIKQDGSVWTWIYQFNYENPVALDYKYLDFGLFNQKSFYYGPAPIVYIGIRLDGSLWTWGDNISGELGTGSINPEQTPKKIGENYLSFKFIRDRNTFIARKNDGTTWAWGGDADYFTSQSGASILVPTQINSEFTSIDPNGDPIFATKKDGSIWGWSSNESGQLGDGTYNPSTKDPILIGNNYTKISRCTGAYRNLAKVTAINHDGTIWEWGGSSATDSAIKKLIGTGYSALLQCGLATKSDGTLWGWGYYAPGSSSTPVKIVLP